MSFCCHYIIIQHLEITLKRDVQKSYLKEKNFPQYPFHKSTRMRFHALLLQYRTTLFCVKYFVAKWIKLECHEFSISKSEVNSWSKTWQIIKIRERNKIDWFQIQTKFSYKREAWNYIFVNFKERKGYASWRFF